MYISVTIKDIARMSGVSRGTVDRVVHNRGGVVPEVEERVRILLDKFEYIPNKAGKILEARRNPLKIGCFLPLIGNDFFDDVLAGFRSAEDDLSDFGVSIDVSVIRGYEINEHESAINKLVQEGCKALCLTTVDVPEIRECVNRIIKSGIPVITVNTDISDTDRLCYIGSDYNEGGRVSGKLMNMIGENDLRILIVTGSKKIKGHNERIDGFLHTLSEYGTRHNIINISESLDDNDIAYHVVLNVLKEYPCINCVFVAGGGAYGICLAIRESGIRLLHKTSVVVFDDVESTKCMIRSGDIDFTICQEPHRQGSEAIHRMFNYFISNKMIKPSDCFTQTVIKLKENI